MPEAVVDGIQYNIGADNSEFMRAIDEVQRANERAAEEMGRDFDRAGEGIVGAITSLSSRTSGLGTAISTAFQAARFHPAVTAVTGLVGQFQSAQEKVASLSERITEVGPKIGEGWDDRVENFNVALSDLSASSAAAFQFAAVETTGLGRALTWVIDKATEAARRMARISESGLPDERQSSDLLDERVAALQRRIAELQSTSDADFGGQQRAAQQQRDMAAAMSGPEGAWAVPPAQEIEERSQAIARLTGELEHLQGVVEDRDGVRQGHVTIDAITQQIEAMRKQNLELRIQAETFGMAAEEAAKYAAQLRAVFAAGGETRFNQMTAEQRTKLMEQINETARLRDEIDDNDKGKRAGDARQRIFTGADQEVERLRAQQRALTMTAEAAAAYNFEQREMLKFQQARIKPTDDDIARIKQRAEEFGKETEALKGLQRQMQIVQSFGSAFSSAISSAFTGWLNGAEQSWSKFFHSLSTRIATLALESAILQPLFGGGGVQGGGLFGTLLSGLVSGVTGTGGIPARAEGGPVSSGRPYMVGERGPELFVPGNSGTIVPNGGGRSGGATINMRVDLAGANGDETIARIAGQAAQIAFTKAVQASNAGFAARQSQLRSLGA